MVVAVRFSRRFVSLWAVGRRSEFRVVLKGVSNPRSMVCGF